MENGGKNLTPAQLEARRTNAKKSTGPRTPEGKKRSSQNARKHGLYSNSAFFREAAITLGENPREFDRLLNELMGARQPGDAFERVLVEDIALLIWKKARLDRAEAAVQMHNLQKHDLERRKLSIQVGRAIGNTSEFDAREYGLRGSLDAPGKFEQVIALLYGLVEMVEKNDFSSLMLDSLRAVYGSDMNLRGAGLHTCYSVLAKMKAGDERFEDLKNSMRERLAEEIADVGREYQLFRQEHVENTRAGRVAATAPSHAQWAALIRQQNSLNRQLERKIRLLKEMQEERQAKEQGFADRHEASFAESAAPRLCPVTGVGQINSGCDHKKILNRGNEAKDLL